MRLLALVFLCFFIPTPSFSSSDSIDTVFIEVNGTLFSGTEFYQAIDIFISKRFSTPYQQQKIYKKLIHSITPLTERSKKMSDIHQVLQYGHKQSIKKSTKYYSQTQKVILGYNENGQEIVGYYRGAPDRGYFGIFSNIHGGYEYGTYKTTLYLKQELEKSDATGWFIIPTINPYGLEYYFNYSTLYDAYIKGRGNQNNVDLNRNFCTSNFILTNFIKNGETFQTGRGGCESEAETRIIVDTLSNYTFNKVISLHSQGNIFFIPDGSIDDSRVIAFGKQLSNILPGYRFDIDFYNDHQKKQKIREYEIDEGGSGNYTGTMETYIYEQYDIPVILVELNGHGKIEYELRRVVEFLD